MDVIRTGKSGAVISLDSSDCNLILTEEGKVDAASARYLAVHALQSAGIPHNGFDFSFDIFLGRGCGMIFVEEKDAAAYQVYKFSSLDDAAKCAAVLPESINAELYHMDGAFFIGVRGCGKAEILILLEYGESVQRPDVFLDTVEKQGKTISSVHTISMLRTVV